MRPSYRSRWYPIWDYLWGTRAHLMVWRHPHEIAPEQPHACVPCRRVPWWQRYRWHRATKTWEHCARYYLFFPPDYTIVETFGCAFCGCWLWRKAVCPKCRDTVANGLKDWDLCLDKELLRAAYSHKDDGGVSTT